MQKFFPERQTSEGIIIFDLFEVETRGLSVRRFSFLKETFRSLFKSISIVISSDLVSSLYLISLIYDDTLIDEERMTIGRLCCVNFPIFFSKISIRNISFHLCWKKKDFGTDRKEATLPNMWLALCIGRWNYITWYASMYCFFKKSSHFMFVLFGCADGGAVASSSERDMFEFPSSFVTFSISQKLFGKVHHFPPLQSTCSSALVGNQYRKNATLKSMTDKENFNNF